MQVEAGVELHAILMRQNSHLLQWVDQLEEEVAKSKQEIAAKQYGIAGFRRCADDVT